MNKKNIFIDSDAEHNRVLAELGILDDDDDWKMFQQLQRAQLENEPDFEIYAKYVNHLKKSQKGKEDDFEY